MTELTPKERVMRVFRKEPVDTMPFFSGYGMVVMPAITKLGYQFAKVHSDKNMMVQSAIESSRMFGFDSVQVPFDMTCESQALGNEISLYEDSEDILYPTIPEKRWKGLDEVEIPDNILELGRMPMIIDSPKRKHPIMPSGPGNWDPLPWLVSYWNWTSCSKGSLNKKRWWNPPWIKSAT
jgi:[methyl-Co(III) methanol-specific corrinoid protein]:coenzyme M methyltransferase